MSFGGGGFNLKAEYLTHIHTWSTQSLPAGIDNPVGFTAAYNFPSITGSSQRTANCSTPACLKDLKLFRVLHTKGNVDVWAKDAKDAKDIAKLVRDKQLDTKIIEVVDLQA